MGEIYLISTPIGNLNDLTSRSRDLFCEGLDIYAENPLRALKLTSYLGSQSKVYKYIDNPSTLREIVARAKSGARVIYITGAGMPSLSDPGADIASAALEEGVKVTPVTGATSLVFLSVCGLDVSKFAFLGFLKKGKAFEVSLLHTVSSVLFFDNPKRLKKTLRSILKVATEAGIESQLFVSLGIELTKKFESVHKHRLVDIEQIDLGFRGEVIVGIGYSVGCD